MRKSAGSARWPASRSQERCCSPSSWSPRRGRPGAHRGLQRWGPLRGGHRHGRQLRGRVTAGSVGRVLRGALHHSANDRPASVQGPGTSKIVLNSTLLLQKGDLAASRVQNLAEWGRHIIENLRASSRRSPDLHLASSSTSSRATCPR